MARLKDLVTRCTRRLTPPPGRPPRRPRALHLEALAPRTVPAPLAPAPPLGLPTVARRLVQPISMAFLGDNDFFVLEKTTGKVQHVINGVAGTPAIDLAVNNASERGLLGIALSPHFRNDHLVYLYWTQSSTGADSNRLQDV